MERPKNETDNVVPRIWCDGKQSYMLHLNDNPYAVVVTGFRNDVIETIENSNFEVVKVKMERNFYGLNDYRIFCRIRPN